MNNLLGIYGYEQDVTNDNLKGLDTDTAGKSPSEQSEMNSKGAEDTSQQDISVTIKREIEGEILLYSLHVIVRSIHDHVVHVVH